MPDKHAIVSEWFEKGEHDITGARILFESNHFTDTIAMLIQQAIEKYLKGYLIFHGWKLMKIHDLVKLLAETIKFDQGFEKFEDDCRRISEYYFESRYPLGRTTNYSIEEIKNSLEIAEAIIRKIKASFNRY